MTIQNLASKTAPTSFTQTCNLNELDALCDEILKHLKERCDSGQSYVLLLRGEIGAGKTSFVKALFKQDHQSAKNTISQATTQNTATQNVTSPTFSLAQSYESVQFGEFHHYDLYRKSLEEMLLLGLLDMLSCKGLHLIEWGDESLESLLHTHGFHFGILSIATMPQTHSRIYKVAL